MYGEMLSEEFENWAMKRYPRRIAEVILHSLIEEIVLCPCFESDWFNEDVGDDDVKVEVLTGSDEFGLPHAWFKIDWTQTNSTWSRYNPRYDEFDIIDEETEVEIQVEVEILVD